ncbi:MAG: phage tail terminator-like protein [Xanthobacteraceae bacterium]
MPEPVEVAIEYALLTRAQAFAAAQSPAIAISQPNIAFTPPTASATAKWLRATFLPAPTATLPVGSGSDRYYGIMQIDVFYGQGAGELAPGRLASAVIDYFNRGTTVTKDDFTTRVYRRPSRGPMIKDDPWMMIPVTINFECFATA